MTQKPTVGRIVLYRPQASTGKSQLYPAIITHVWSDSCVNLHVFNDDSWPLLEKEGSEFVSGTCLTSVSAAGDPENMSPRSWIWPPRENPQPAAAPAESPLKSMQP